MQRALAALALTVVAAGCGAAGQSPAEEVRATEVKAVEALTSDHPERACQYATDHDACVGSVVALRALKVDTRAVTGIPDDWRARVDRAKITVHGDRATLSPGPTGKTAHFVLRQGRWLAQNG